MMKQILQTLGFTLEKIVHANEINISEDVKSYKISLESDIWRTGLKMAELKLNGRYTFDDFNQGVTLSMIATDEVSQTKDWGTFYLVDKSNLEYSDHTDETVLTLHDGMIKAHQEFLQADLGITFPCTIDTLVNAIGTYMGLNVSGSWVNGSHSIEENKWENNGLTYRDALDDIAFVTNTTIGVFNDVLTFKPVNKTVVDTIDGGELSLTHEAKWGKPNVLNLTREPQHDNYAYPTDFTEIPKDDRVELVIENNQIIDKRREELAPTLFNQIQNVEYTPFEYTGFGYLTMDYGDYVGFKDKDGNIQYGYVTKLEWQVGSGFTEMLGCELTTRAKEEYVLNTDQRRLGLQTYFLVDQQNGIIKGLINKADDMEEKQSQFQMDLEKIGLGVKYANFSNIISNGSGELDNYVNWFFPTENPNLFNFATLKNRKGTNQFVIFEPVENENSLPLFDLSFFANGNAESRYWRVFNEHEYGLRIKRTLGNQSYILQIIEYDKDKVEINTQSYTITEDLKEISNISFDDKTLYVGVAIITSNVSLENRLNLTELTLSIGTPKLWEPNVSDLLQFAQSDFEILSNQIKATVEEVKNVDGKTVENRGLIDLIGNQAVIKVQQNGSLALVDILADADDGSLIQLRADQLKIDATTTFASGYNPMDKATPSDVSNAEASAKDYAEGKASDAETNAKGYAKDKANSAETNAKTYANTVGSNTLIDAKTYTQTYTAEQRGQIEEYLEQYTDDQIDTFSGGLGDLAFKNLIGQAMLDDTIIDGGYIKTSLISFDNAVGTNVNLTGYIKATDGEFTGNVKAGLLGGLTIDNQGILLPNEEIRLNSVDSSLDFGGMKMKHDIFQGIYGDEDVIIIETATGQMEFRSGIEYSGGSLPNSLIVKSIATSSISVEDAEEITIGGLEGTVPTAFTGGYYSYLIPRRTIAVPTSGGMMDYYISDSISQRITVFRDGNTVTIIGALEPTSQQAVRDIVTNNGVVAFTVPFGFRPMASRVDVLCQGSGSAMWLATVYQDGRFIVSRYRGRTPTTTEWLPFAITYVTEEPYYPY